MRENRDPRGYKEKKEFNPQKNFSKKHEAENPNNQRFMHNEQSLLDNESINQSTISTHGSNMKSSNNSIMYPSNVGQFIPSHVDSGNVNSSQNFSQIGSNKQGNMYNKNMTINNNTFQNINYFSTSPLMNPLIGGFIPGLIHYQNNPNMQGSGNLGNMIVKNNSIPSQRSNDENQKYRKSYKQMVDTIKSNNMSNQVENTLASIQDTEDHPKVNHDVEDFFETSNLDSGNLNNSNATDGRSKSPGSQNNKGGFQYRNNHNVNQLFHTTNKNKKIYKKKVYNDKTNNTQSPYQQVKTTDSYGALADPFQVSGNMNNISLQQGNSMNRSVNINLANPNVAISQDNSNCFNLNSNKNQNYVGNQLVNQGYMNIPNYHHQGIQQQIPQDKRDQQNKVKNRKPSHNQPNQPNQPNNQIGNNNNTKKNFVGFMQQPSQTHGSPNNNQMTQTSEKDPNQRVQAMTYQGQNAFNSPSLISVHSLGNIPNLNNFNLLTANPNHLFQNFVNQSQMTSIPQNNNMQNFNNQHHHQKHMAKNPGMGQQINNKSTPYKTYTCKDLKQTFEQKKLNETTDMKLRIEIESGTVKELNLCHKRDIKRTIEDFCKNNSISNDKVSPILEKVNTAFKLLNSFSKQSYYPDLIKASSEIENLNLSCLTVYDNAEFPIPEDEDIPMNRTF